MLRDAMEEEEACFSAMVTPMSRSAAARVRSAARRWGI